MINSLITGSVAAYHWFPDFRIPNDVDFISKTSIHSSKPSQFNVESHWEEPFSKIIQYNVDPVFVDPEFLLTLKMSHFQWDIKWDKTKSDIMFLKNKGIKYNEELYLELVEHWKTVHKKKSVNLKQSVDTFFDDYVDRIYDHETVHSVVAFNDKPMHEVIRPDKDSVWCDKKLFDVLPETHKIHCFLEELIVTAIERGRLKAGCKKSEKLIAVNKAYKSLVTSMTSGWFTDFMIDNILVLNQQRDLILHKIDLSLSTLENFYGIE